MGYQMNCDVSFDPHQLINQHFTTHNNLIKTSLEYPKTPLFVPRADYFYLSTQKLYLIDICIRKSVCPDKSVFVIVGTNNH